MALAAVRITSATGRRISLLHHNLISHPEEGRKWWKVVGSLSSYSSSPPSPYGAQRSLHTALPSLDIFNVQDEADFKAKVLDNSKPVIVEFHAAWCGPCKLLMPRMEKAMSKYKDKVDMAKVDIDEYPELAMEYNVGAVPSVLSMKSGKVLDKFVGLKDEDQIDTFVAATLK